MHPLQPPFVSISSLPAPHLSLLVAFQSGFKLVTGQPWHSMFSGFQSFLTAFVFHHNPLRITMLYIFVIDSDTWLHSRPMYTININRKTVSHQMDCEKFPMNREIIFLRLHVKADTCIYPVSHPMKIDSFVHGARQPESEAHLRLIPSPDCIQTHFHVFMEWCWVQNSFTFNHPLLT
jgi:hypothetical protein